MGKITEQLQVILKAESKNDLISKAKQQADMINTPPLSLTITYCNGKLYINNNLGMFNIDNQVKTKLLVGLLEESLNLIKKEEGHDG